MQLDDAALAGRIERVSTIVATDGIQFDRQGHLWLGGLENSSLARYVPGGTYEQVLENERLRWPDTFAVGPDEKIYVTTTQIHLQPAERGRYTGQASQTFSVSPMISSWTGVDHQLPGDGWKSISLRSAPRSVPRSGWEAVHLRNSTVWDSDTPRTRCASLANG